MNRLDFILLFFLKIPLLIGDDKLVVRLDTKLISLAMLFYWKCLVHFVWHFSIAKQLNSCKKIYEQQIDELDPKFKSKKHVDEKEKKCFSPNFLVYDFDRSEKVPENNRFEFLDVQSNRKLSCSFHCCELRCRFDDGDQQQEHPRRRNNEPIAETRGNADLHDKVF